MKQLKSAPETTQFEDSRWFLAGDAVRAQICLLPQRPARSPKKPLRRAARSNKLKRGHKKGKSKASKAARVSEAPKPVPSENVENDSANDQAAHDEPDLRMEANTPSSSGTDQPSNVASINPDGSIEKTSKKPVGRVKVKLKTSKILDSQHNSSDAPTQSDTDKSSQKMDVDKQVTDVDKKEDSIDSVPETNAGTSENPSKKAASIRIKTPKALASLSNQADNAVGGEVESMQVQQEEPKESVQQKEPKEAVRNSQHNKQELDSALMVIRKVMKMEAAEPFNVPVDPIALGIPDYFDVIDTPMDFGTICTNLENGEKYRNSEDVFNDVQYIWGNCYKYNNKGDYILDLMRRVKKNFMKYWTAAGLYSGSESAGENGSGKGGFKPKGKKRHGFRRHKSNCLCAICVLKRKRKEREERERMERGQVAEELKQEEPLNLGSPYGEGSSSNSEDSQDRDADADMEDKGEEVKLEPSQQQQHSPRNQKERGEDEKDRGDDETETRQSDDSQTQPPDKSQDTDSLGVETATKQQVKGPESSGVQESSQKEIALEKLEENAAVQHQKMKVFSCSTSIV
ncbi:hypothetical protein CRG98_026638 [Punica granatum]|uniref:Bromo domain-containing protein n=1 Tax=Punica granatum TaxID=22663 RepID=A0A2I0J9Z2_PUNGR|nr:hypothetical protein CRG98_026638 [Punica granatum]